MLLFVTGPQLCAANGWQRLVVLRIFIVIDHNCLFLDFLISPNNTFQVTDTC